MYVGSYTLGQKMVYFSERLNQLRGKRQTEPPHCGWLKELQVHLCIPFVALDWKLLQKRVWIEANYIGQDFFYTLTGSKHTRSDSPCGFWFLCWRGAQHETSFLSVSWIFIFSSLRDLLSLFFPPQQRETLLKVIKGKTFGACWCVLSAFSLTSKCTAASLGAHPLVPVLAEVQVGGRGTAPADLQVLAGLEWLFAIQNLPILFKCCGKVQTVAVGFYYLCTAPDSCWWKPAWLLWRCCGCTDSRQGMGSCCSL